jgi:2-aminoadipate transaminase
LAKTANLHNEEQVLITSGSTQAMDIAVKVLCDEGDIVLCEEQTFSGAVNAIKGYGAIPIPIPMNVTEESVDLEALEELLRFEQRIKFIYLIPTFQNPLGTSIPLEKRQAIYSLAQKYDVLIFEDDPYGDLLYYGEPIMKLKEMDTDGRVMYAGSFSKILAPSARLGFIMAPDEIMEKLALAKQVSDSHTNFYWQVMLAEFMQNHQFEEHVSALKLYYKEKFEAMIAGLEALPEDKIQFIKPTGGYFICCKMADDLDPETFYTALDEAKVAVIPGNVMSVAQEGYERSFRLNFTKPTLSEIVDGVKVIGEALEQATPASCKQVI